MKNSMLIIATVVLSVFNLNATTLLNEKPLKSNNKVIKIYDWNLELEDGKFSGTSLSFEDAQKVLKLLSKGEFVLHKQITSYYVLQNESQNSNYRSYFWEVQTENGYAKGFASTKEKAKKLINLVAVGEIVTFKIVKSEVASKK